MNHNIVTDNEGNEHQAVEPTGFACSNCSLNAFNCDNFFSPCAKSAREDKTEAIYKRRIKIGDIRDLK